MAVICHLIKSNQFSLNEIIEKNGHNLYYGLSDKIDGIFDVFVEYEKSRLPELVQEKLDQYVAANKFKLRKDAVICCSFLLGADQSFMESLSREKQIGYLRKCASFFIDRYGYHNFLEMSICFGEEHSPYACLHLFPLLQDGRLCAKEMFKRIELFHIQHDLPRFLNAHGFFVEAGNKTSDVKNFKEIFRRLDHIEHSIEALELKFYEFIRCDRR